MSTGPTKFDCVALDSATNQCSAWVEVPNVTLADHLPTVEQANTVGMVFFGSLVILAAMKLLLPPKESDT